MSALGLIAKVIPAEGAIKLAIAGGALLLAFAGGFYQGAARVEQRLQKSTAGNHRNGSADGTAVPRAGKCDSQRIPGPNRDPKGTI